MRSICSASYFVFWCVKCLDCCCSVQAYKPFTFTRRNLSKDDDNECMQTTCREFVAQDQIQFIPSFVVTFNDKHANNLGK